MQSGVNLAVCAAAVICHIFTSYTCANMELVTLHTLPCAHILYNMSVMTCDVHVCHCVVAIPAAL